VAFAAVLYGLYLREDNKEILQALITALDDDDQALRMGVARSLGDLKRREAALPLLARLEKETDERVQIEIFTALEAIVQKLEVNLWASAGYDQGETQYLEENDKSASPSRDDCVELYFDSDHKIRPFVQIIVNSVGAVEDRLNRGRDGGAIAPGAVWGFNICPVRVTNLSEFSQWAPTYGDSQRPDRLGYLVFGD
jgi:hypothetical protein